MALDLDYRHVLSLLAMLVTFTAYFPYIRGILRGQIKPHVFSWVIWGATTTIVFMIQLAADGGAGAWPTGLSGMMTILIAILAFMHRADNAISRVDTLFFIAALSSLPLWYFTANPLLAVIILTLVDLLGFGPTARKAYERPFEEDPLFFSLFMLQYTLVILALESRTLTTVLFPAAMVAACLAIISIITVRRRSLQAERQTRQ